MATAPSLFGATPEELRQQQAGALDAQAMQYAQMSPFQRATYGIYKGANQLGGAVGGMLGGTDPQMAEASQVQQIVSRHDTSTPEGLQGLARDFAASGRNRQALQASQAAQAQQLQTAQVGKANAEAVKASREPAAAIPPDIQKVQLEAQLRQGLRLLENETSPEAASSRQSLQDQLVSLTRTKDPALSDIGKLLTERAALNPVTDRAAYNDYTARIKKLNTGGGIGSEIAGGLNPLVSALLGNQQKAGGTELGKDAAKNIALGEGKQEALYAITDSLDLLKKGIYAGGYAPLETALATYGMGIVGDKKRLANTQEFKSYLAEVVIPRLKDFGGSDTEQELKYLQDASGANTTNEPQALANMLGRAEKKMQRSLERISRQNKELQTGQPITVGPVGEGKPTRRYNPQTRAFEAIGGN